VHLSSLNLSSHQFKSTKPKMATEPHYNIIITGASSGFGAMTSRALAIQGHTVYAGVRQHESPQISEIKSFAEKNGVDLRWVLLDITSDKSVQDAVERVISEVGRIDVLMHNAGHMSYGVAEAFSPKQLADLFEVNVIGAQRLNRVALPYMRKSSMRALKEEDKNTNGGLVIWVGSSSSRGGTPPFFGPYFAAKAAMDALAISYAGELSRWGIETSIIIPGAYTKGTNHFGDGMQPEDASVSDEYVGESGPYHGFTDKLLERVVKLEPEDADPEDVAKAVVRVVQMGYGTRPLRTHVNTEFDGAHVVNAVADRMREDAMRRYGFEELLRVRKLP
jgi:NAD(P)-dependent dehydrogenase (short-subunit alcohol dehydrogenase family)